MNIGSLLRTIKIFIFAVVMGSVASSSGHAMTIENIKTPKGLTVWLVRETSLPLVTVRFSFSAGSTQDEKGKEGTAHVMTSLLDEGAGEDDGPTFQRKVEDLAARLSFTAGLDTVNGELRSISTKTPQAFALLKAALTTPRFDSEAIERVRASIKAQLLSEHEEPETLADQAFFKAIFPEHPYARPSHGTKEGVSAITQDDIKASYQKIITKEKLSIVAVGDIDKKTLSTLIDDTFAGLPQTSKRLIIRETNVTMSPTPNVISLNVPQSVIMFGRQGLKRDDKDFIPAFVLNHMLGGGTFSSRLYKSLREEKGFTYSISTGLLPLKQAGVWYGSYATRNESVKEAQALVESEISRLIKEGVTEQELAAAKHYLTGSYALRFDTSTKITAELLGIQRENLGIDYIEKRNALINAVTVKDLQRVAMRLLADGKLTTIIVGNPK